ncbi:MAG: sulfatase-like hydrolase/transferase [Verrucomicrobiota bacterium]
MRKTALAFLLSATAAGADPMLNSWFTEFSGRYARAYTTLAQQAAQDPGTTWDHPIAGRNEQLTPTYSGVHEISYTADHVFIRTTGLGSHIMGPWFGNAAQTQTFANFPSNTATLYRLARDPGTPPVNKIPTGLGVIGFFVDGVAMFDSRDAFSYDTSEGVDEQPNSPANIDGDDVWNRDAFVNEGVTFDSANAHQAGPTYHYHANPPALRYLLGDSVDWDSTTNTYTENFDGGHSPIIGWVEDSYPVYGPYGYSDPMDENSPVVRMISGYQKRDGTNGTTDISNPVNGRTSLPQWAAEVQGIGTLVNADRYDIDPSLYGPGVTPGAGSAFELGHYLEDYAYKGHLGMTFGVDFDTDIHGGRVCRTPEFPNGTYAYFTSIEPDGTPVFPYNIGRTYYGNPTGVRNPGGGIPVNAEKLFEGGPEAELQLDSVQLDNGSGDVTITWSAVEGGKYTVVRAPDANFWQPVTGEILAESDIASTVDPGIATTDPRQFYKVDLNKVAGFDAAGFAIDGDFVEGTGTPPTFVATFATSPPLPPASFVDSITIGGLEVTVLCYNQATGEVEVMFDSSSLTPGTSYDAVINYTPPGGSPTTVTSTNQYTVPNPSTDPNILFLIVDDWGIDRSPIDNTLNVPLPNMPNLQSLAAGGLRFSRAYVTPVCSPTRAAIMTGRHAHQTGVWVPGNAGAFSNTIDEFTLPEAFTAAGSDYSMGSMGKWHLGGGDTGYDTRGGWDEFYGITGGGVPDYLAWNKNSNGTVAATTTYSTTDQVNEALAFINREETAGNPWFCWVAFNAPHDPFHDPPAGLAPAGGYSAQAPGENANRWNYRKMCEALDTEIGRLLVGVDQSKTNIILIGDNGTPNQVVQAPFGPEGAGQAANAKGDLYNGGIHVPMVYNGPLLDIGLIGTTTDTLVHAVDLYSTMLEMGGIDVSTVAGIPQTTLDQSHSIIPILQDNDTTDRCVITEGGEGAARGRAIMVDDYPDYKMIIFGDPEDLFETPMIEFYNIASDFNEQSPLYNGVVTATPGLAGTDQLAYDACFAKNTAMGGGFTDPPLTIGDTLYLELPNITGPASPPNNLNVMPTSITITDGNSVVQTATLVARNDFGTDLADESDDAAARYWVKCTLPGSVTGPYSTAVVTFPNNPNNGAARVFTAIQIVVKP